MLVNSVLWLLDNHSTQRPGPLTFDWLTHMLLVGTNRGARVAGDSNHATGVGA